MTRPALVLARSVRMFRAVFVLGMAIVLGMGIGRHLSQLGFDLPGLRVECSNPLLLFCQGLQTRGLPAESVVDPQSAHFAMISGCCVDS